MKRAIGWRMAGLILLVTGLMASVVQAQQPTVVFSIRGIEELLDDVDFVGEEVGQEGLKEGAEAQLMGVTGGKGLAGIDQKKPLGFYWNATGGGTEMPVVFLPVSDADDLKELLTDLTPDFKDEKGQWSFTVGGTKVSAKLANGYCFASPSPTAIAKLPDPSKIVNAKYDLAVEINLAGIPNQFKQIFLSQTEAGGRASMENGPAAKNEAEEFGRKFGFENTLAGLKSITNDGDRVTIGIDVNSETRLVGIDFGITAKANTDLAKPMTTFGKTTPLFSGLGAETAPFRLVLSYPTSGLTEQLDKLFSVISDSAMEEIKKSDQFDSDDDRDLAKGFATRILDIAKATVKSGSLHSGLVLEPATEGKVRIVAGTKVAKGADAEKVLDEILNLLKDSPDVAEVKIDAAKHAGVRIHAVNPKKDEDAEKYLGDEPIHFAVRNDSVWFAAGVDNLSALKKALDQFGKTSTRTSAPVSLQIKPASLVLLMEKDDEDLIERAKEVAGKPGDKLIFEIAPVSNGAKARLEFGVDLLGLAAQNDEK